MRTSPFLIVLLSTLLGAGCSLLGSDREVRHVPVEKVELTDRSDLQIQLQVTGIWFNTCGAFDRFETDREGSTYTVRMYGRHGGGSVCGDALTPITGTWKAEVPQPGAYTFRFSQPDGSAVDTTFTTWRSTSGITSTEHPSS